MTGNKVFDEYQPPVDRWAVLGTFHRVMANNSAKYGHVHRRYVVPTGRT